MEPGSRSQQTLREQALVNPSFAFRSCQFARIGSPILSISRCRSWSKLTACKDKRLSSGKQPFVPKAGSGLPFLPCHLPAIGNSFDPKVIGNWEGFSRRYILEWRWTFHSKMMRWMKDYHVCACGSWTWNDQIWRGQEQWCRKCGAKLTSNRPASNHLKRRRWLQPLQNNKEQLPEEVRHVMEKTQAESEPSQAEQCHRGSQHLTRASHRLRLLVKKQIDQQSRITETRKRLRLELQEVQAIGQQLKEAQAEVEQAREARRDHYATTQPDGVGEQDANDDIGKVMDQLGIKLEGEKKDLLKDLIRCRKRAASPISAPPGLKARQDGQGDSFPSEGTTEDKKEPEGWDNKDPAGRGRSRTPIK